MSGALVLKEHLLVGTNSTVAKINLQFVYITQLHFAKLVVQQA